MRAGFPFLESFLDHCAVNLHDTRWQDHVVPTLSLETVKKFASSLHYLFFSDGQIMILQWETLMKSID